MEVLRQARQRLAAIRRHLADEAGFSTAELLGNAALGVVALVVIWGLLQALGVDVVNMITSEILGGGGGAGAGGGGGG